MMKSVSRFLAVALMAVLASSCQLLFPPQEETGFVDELPITGVERPLQQGDSVTVSLQLPNSLSASDTTDVVNSADMITLPWLGNVKVGGLTTAEARNFIRDCYIKGGYYKDCNVKVISTTMQGETSRTLSVTGEVNRKGPIQWRDGMTLRTAIIAAGDVGPFAGDRLILQRGNGRRKYSMKEITKDPSKDPLVYPRDVIEVMERIF